MRYVVIAIRDRAADTYTAPSFAVSIGAAKRSFRDLINSGSDAPVCKHPEDFDLYLLGEFNDADGLFDAHVPRMIEVGKDSVDTRREPDRLRLPVAASNGSVHV